MSVRSTSPTSLLWAHQLKKEHNYLLGRIKSVEAKFEQINGLAAQIQKCEAISQAEVIKGVKVDRTLEKVEETQKELLQRIGSTCDRQQEEVSTRERAESLWQQKLSSIESAIESFRSDKEKNALNEASLVNRLETLEETQEQMKKDIDERQIQHEIVDAAAPQPTIAHAESEDVTEIEDAAPVDPVIALLKKTINSLTASNRRIDEGQKLLSDQPSSDQAQAHDRTSATMEATSDHDVVEISASQMPATQPRR